MADEFTADAGTELFQCRYGEIVFLAGERVFQHFGLADEKFLATLGLGEIRQIPGCARRDGWRVGGKLAQGVHGFSEKQEQSISKPGTANKI